jgi:tetratricopeptide (TPR) repeat protein
MYLKGGLDAQAAVEVNAALGEDPERPDLLVVLANAYWKMGKSAEAAEVCNRLLDKLPYCLEANQILARILWKMGRKQEAQDVFRRLATLDPYVGVRPPTEDGRMPDVPAEAVLLDRLSWTPPLEEQKGPPPGWAEGLGLKKEDAGKVEIPEWLEPSKSLPLEPASPFGAEAEESPFHAPDWLGEAASEIPDTSGIQAEKLLEPEEPEAALARTGQELPDWLKGGPTPEGTPPAPPTPDDWLSPPKPPKEEPTGDFAEWLKAVGGEESLARAGEGLPEWLKPEGEPAQPAEHAEALPEWLKGEAAQPGQTTEEYPEISSEGAGEGAAPTAEGSLDWLSQGGSEQIVSPFDLAAAGESDTGGKLPEWLETEMREAPGLAAGEAGRESQEGNLVPAEEEPPSSPGQPPSWLKLAESEASRLSASAQPPESGSAGPSAEVAPAVPATELPEWLQPEIASPESVAGESSLPDWLRMEASQGGGKPLGFPDLAKSEVTPGPAGEPSKEKEAELPEWLASTSAPPAQPASSGEETSTSQGEIPDWLKRIATEASSVPEEETPAEVEMGTGELPSWLESRQPGASDTISKWLGERLGPHPPTEEKLGPRAEAEDLPEWLRPAVEAGAEPNQPEMEMSEPAPQAGPALPESRPRVEKAGEQAPPDWLRTALDLAKTEVTSVLPAQAAPPSHPAEASPQMPQAPAEEQGVPSSKLEVSSVRSVPVAGSVHEPALTPIAGEKPTPPPAPGPFMSTVGEEEVASAPERPQWVPVVEPAVVPPVEKVQPRRKEPSRAAASKAPVVPRQKPRRMTQEDAALLLAQGRKCLEESREQEAAAAYQKLLESGRCVEEMADDLEKAVGDFPDSSGLWQLLGDASSRLGRLQRAYEAYGKALEKI